MRFHIPSLPGRPVLREFSSCAYTAKLVKFRTMMRARGHEVIIYGGEGADVECYPESDPLPFDISLWGVPNAHAAQEINARREEGDYLLLVAGRCQEAIAQAVPLVAVEAFIGYGGVFADFRVYESYAWQAVVSAAGHPDPHALDGNAYHAVIPNYFDVGDFPFGEGSDDHLLYVGRLIERKGVEVAVNVARATGDPLFLAGEGDYRPGEGEAGIIYLGPVGPEQRANLMRDARCLLAPTQYVEPFGGVVVEAALCGTPAITTDWGAFPETVAHGETGYRCRRLGEFIWAAEHAGDLERAACRIRAKRLYSTEAIAPRYESYFEHLATLKSGGWYDPTPAPPRLAAPGA